MADDEAAEPDTGTPDDILEDAKEAFKFADEHEAQNRKDALEDIRFGRLDEQWDPAIIKQRQDDGRPCLTTNLLRPIMLQVLNAARQNRPAIRCHPASDNADPKTAEILNGLIRNIEKTSKADVAYDTAVDGAISGGFGYFRIETRYTDDDSFDLELAISAIPNQFSVWGDPKSTAADSSDWNTAFITDLISQDDFEKKYKGAQKVDWQTGSYSTLDANWREDAKVRVAEYWTREEVQRTILKLSTGEVVGEDVWNANQDTFQSLGVTVIASRPAKSHKVRQYVLTGAEVLEERDWAGRFIPIIPCYGEEINVEGRRYFRSLIRSAKDAQRKHNFWDSAATELVALAPRSGWVGAKGSFATDEAKWRSDNTVSWGYKQYDPVAGQPPPFRPQIDFAGAAAALNQAAAAANDVMAVIGVHEPGLGQPVDGEASGRALLAMQSRSDTSSYHFQDNQNRAIEHGGRVLVDLIPLVYTGERTIRIIGDRGQRLPPVQIGAQPQPDPLTGEIARVYDLTAGKYDVDIDAGANSQSRKAMSAASMTEFAQNYPPAAPVLAPRIAKMADWPDAETLPQELAGVDPRLQALQQQLQAAQQQIAQLGQQGQASQAALNDLQVQLDKAKSTTDVQMAQVAVDRYNAETNRWKAFAPKGVQIDPMALGQAVMANLGSLATTTDLDPGQIPPLVGVDGQPFGVQGPAPMPVAPPQAPQGPFGQAA